jgi:hypothetical protein
MDMFADGGNTGAPSTSTAGSSMISPMRLLRALGVKMAFWRQVEQFRVWRNRVDRSLELFETGVHQGARARVAQCTFRCGPMHELWPTSVSSTPKIRIKTLQNTFA